MPRRPSARPAGEEADHYPRVVIRWDRPNGSATRIIECRHQIQWIVQRRRGTRNGIPVWRSVSFCRTRNALQRLLPGNADEIASLLPERFPDPSLNTTQKARLTMAPDHQNDTPAGLTAPEQTSPAPGSRSAALRARYPWVKDVNMELPTHEHKARPEGEPLWRAVKLEPGELEAARARALSPRPFGR